MIDLSAREQRLVNRFPTIPWLDPQLITIPGHLSGLTCRFCTALDGLRASELGQVGFAGAQEFRQHVEQVHCVEGIPAGAEQLAPGIFATADGVQGGER